MRKNRLAIVCIYIFFCTITAVHAATGVIDTSVSNTASVCYDVTCTTPTPSIINFELSQEPSIVVDSVTGISGRVWGNSLGWITFNPAGGGVVFASSRTGFLTGKAWSQVSGWINFAPTGQGVTIDPSSGELFGWAWTGGPYGGWIRFDCTNPATCVKTTWRGDQAPNNNAVVLVDVCPNIPDPQTVIPSGYTVDSSGACVLLTDMCPNLPGEQKEIPFGYIQDSIGACVPSSIDYCATIPGNQKTVPPGMIINSEGVCVDAPKDVCPKDSGVQTTYAQCTHQLADICLNLPGVQEIVPETYSVVDGLCVQKEFDYCANVLGVQPFIPEGFGITENGDCTLLPKDFCTNLGGIQEKTPVGFFGKDGQCFLQAEENDFSLTTKEGRRILALPFIPSIAWIPSENSVLKASASFIGYIVKGESFKVSYGTDYAVDITSLVIVFLIGLSIILGLIITARFLLRKIKTIL